MFNRGISQSPIKCEFAPPNEFVLHATVFTVALDGIGWKLKLFVVPIGICHTDREHP